MRWGERYNPKIPDVDIHHIKTDATGLDSICSLSGWMGRLQKLSLVKQQGKTQATRYFVDPVLLQKLDFPSSTTLSLIEPHRLKALILEDLQRYPGSAISDIHSRTAPELDRHRIKRALEALHDEGAVHYRGEKRWRSYSLAGK